VADDREDAGEKSEIQTPSPAPRQPRQSGAAGSADPKPPSTTRSPPPRAWSGPSCQERSEGLRQEGAGVAVSVPSPPSPRTSRAARAPWRKASKLEFIVVRLRCTAAENEKRWRAFASCAPSGAHPAMGPSRKERCAVACPCRNAPTGRCFEILPCETSQAACAESRS
jgi:hypothetical protein